MSILVNRSFSDPLIEYFLLRNVIFHGSAELADASQHPFHLEYLVLIAFEHATMMNAHCDHIDIKALQGALRHKTPDLAIRVYTKENTNKTATAEKEYDEWLRSQLKQTS